MRITMTDFTALVEYHLQLAAVPFDRDDLLTFLEANRAAIADDQDAGYWAHQFAAYIAGPSFQDSTCPA
jgi:hypothetical protein